MAHAFREKWTQQDSTTIAFVISRKLEGKAIFLNFSLVHQTMSTSVELVADPNVQQQPQEEKDSAITIWDADSEISKNSRSISWTVIFASALANFSDGYQNNLVRFAPGSIVEFPLIEIAVLQHKRCIQTSAGQILQFCRANPHFQCPARRRRHRYCGFGLPV